MDRIKLFLVWAIVVFTSAGAFAAPYSIPKDGARRMWNEGANSWCSYINPLFNYFDATGGVLPEYPVVLGPLSVSGAGNSWLELGNNTSFTDVLTGKGGYGLLNWLPYAILNGTPTRLALFEELAAGDTSIIQDDDPTLASATGKYYSRASGDYFNVVHGIELFTIAGTRTADENAPVIVAGADSTHDGSTPVTATMALTELYPDASTLLYTLTGGTPASGTWSGTYPNYSLEVTPTGTDPIVVTSSGSDLAGNPAIGTRLAQTFAYDEEADSGYVGYSGTSINTGVGYAANSMAGCLSTATATGELSAVHAFLDYITPTAHYNVAIYNAGGSTKLAEGTLTIGSELSDASVNDFTLKSPITVTSGTQYLLCIGSSDDSDWRPSVPSAPGYTKYGPISATVGDTMPTTLTLPSANTDYAVYIWADNTAGH